MADPIVVLEQGKIRGQIENDIRGGTFYSFKGIPYAKPPIGELRFKAPVPADHWTGIRDGTKEGNLSIQPHPVHKIIGSEDCLYLNVYTPGLPLDNPAENNRLPYQKPVMVWIHGGALAYGSSKSSYNGPKFLLTEDIVLVTFNYRLGLLGFLSCEDTTLDVPGNAAFKDMILALKWVRRNITHFLGDPDNVTLFGESAGAGAVDSMIYSPLAKGLFHKAILQSLSVWAPSLYGETVKELAKYMGFENRTEREIFDVLRTSSLENLVEIQNKLEKIRPNSLKKRHIGLVVEKPNASAFLTSAPVDLIKSGKINSVPVIMGYNSMEGVVPDKFSAKWYDIEDYVPHFLNLEKENTDFALLAQKFMLRYFEKNEFSQETFYNVFKELFTWMILHGAKNYVNTSPFPVYLYKFDMDTNLNLFKIVKGYEGPGACHGDDIGYLFHTRFTPEITPGSDEDIGQRRVVRLWTNFARYGNPTPFKDPLLDIIWEPADKSLRYLAMSDTLRMKSDPDREVMEFWEEIIPINTLTSKL